ncbi:AfsR/SARP family transcriptional regulator [Streptomyces sp. NPDC048717]|uniref:AfsR/SARP family transcriptional regulator n=1 Tax=Streptomyces sp. NPDC048717 TaxID=3154928 RepID=UPI00341DB89D
MRFQLLGPLSITDGRDMVVLPPSKPTSLLAALLVRPGEVVPVSRLRQAVWGEEQPATAKAALQSCVLRLRRLFAKYDIEEQSVVAVAGGYLLPADHDSLDLLHFRRLIEQADGAGEAELPLLRTALGLWRGPLLTNVPSDLLHRDEVPRLVEERLRAVERVCEIQLARGRGREVLVDLWEATRAHPQHEGLTAQLMRALYRVGRQNEALAEYRRIRTHLRDELGIDPGAELQRLELSILRGDAPRGPEIEPAARLAVTAGSVASTASASPELSVQPPAQPAGGPAAAQPSTVADTAAGRAGHSPAEDHGDEHLAPAGTTAHGEPAPGATAAPTGRDGRVRRRTSPGPRLPYVPGFTGRSRETADLVAHLSGADSGADGTAPLLALVSGGPGMGKTALALHVAHLVADRYPGGAIVLPMSGPDGTARPTADAAAALRALLPCGDTGDTGDTANAEGTSEPEPCLVILDDVVHPDQVRDLLDTTSPGAVVVTSRLGLAALVATHCPMVLQLGALSPRESRALLTAVLGRDRVAAEAGAARTLAELCGHVPLALRIVAARLLTRPRTRLADYAEWLRRDLPARLALPDDPRMSVPLALDGALGRLPASLADAYLRLARLHGRITAPATAGALAISETEAEELLERLLDHGLLEDDQPGTLWMNELFRAHALYRTARNGDDVPRAVTTPARRALPSGAT